MSQVNGFENETEWRKSHFERHNKGRRVMVYFNLHRRLWSVKCLKMGHVIAHAKTVSLQDCEFRVSKAGRARVIAERRKNVHAGVVGTLIAMDDYETPNSDPFGGETFHKVTYNPYKYETFVTVKGETPVYHSKTCDLWTDQNGVIVLASRLNETKAA